MKIKKTTVTEAENRVHLKNLGHVLGVNAKVSGGPILNFSKGWAVNGFAHTKAHHYRLVRVLCSVNPPSYEISAFSLCGHHLHIEMLFDAGNFDRCKICSRLAIK